ncbi:hypothetical protein C8Q74DRAFT_1218985 [Fomes fomentarius]|nr:hypothetical protein C8Q74DRAFT_1218985 [Fomes fomentarius]
MALHCLAGRRRAVSYAVYMDGNFLLHHYCLYHTSSAGFYPSGDSRGQGCTLVWTCLSVRQSPAVLDNKEDCRWIVSTLGDRCATQHLKFSSADTQDAVLIRPADGRGNMLGLRPREFLARVHATSISGLVTLRVERTEQERDRTSTRHLTSGTLFPGRRVSCPTMRMESRGQDSEEASDDPASARTDVPYRPPALVPVTTDRESLASRRAFGDNDRPVFCIQLQSICCEDIRDPHSAGEGAALAS